MLGYLWCKEALHFLHKRDFHVLKSVFFHCSLIFGHQHSNLALRGIWYISGYWFTAINPKSDGAAKPGCIPSMEDGLLTSNSPYDFHLNWKKKISWLSTSLPPINFQARRFSSSLGLLTCNYVASTQSQQQFNIPRMTSSQVWSHLMLLHFVFKKEPVLKALFIFSSPPSPSKKKTP